MSFKLPYQVLYQNQLQFNLGVPLTTQNLIASYHHPSPIIVERVGGQHAVPSKIVTQKLQGCPQQTDHSGANYSTLSEDKMEVLSQLARRDLKNRALQQAQMASNNASASTSPIRNRVQQQQNVKAQGIRSSRLPPQQKRSRPPLTAKQAEKNRRFGAVQTPPPQRPISYTRPANDSMLNQDSVTVDNAQKSDIFFPVKASVPSETHNPNEIAKLQQDMQGYLRLIGKIVNRAVEEHSTDFLRPAVRGKQRDGYLVEEEGYDRARARVGEQNTRSVRNLYNLRQKVKQLQRDVAQADLNNPVKKNQLSAQLVVVYRGVAKSVQMFLNQLPYQDLVTGLPSHFHELSLLVRQLTGLASLNRSGSPSGSEQGELLALLETIEALNAKWSAQLRGSGAKPREKNEKKPAASKDWVSDTKVDKDIFVTKDKPTSAVTISGQPHKKLTLGQQAGLKKQKQTKQQRVGQQTRIPRGKENRRDFTYRGRRDELRSGIAALLHSRESREEQGGAQPRPVAWEVDIGRNQQKQDPRKGYLLPSDLLTKRQRAQRAVEASNQRERNFSDPTTSWRLKTSLRPSSAPPSPDKRVNFDLDVSQSSSPWVPVGSGQSGSHCSPRSRSASSERRSPFYLRDLDRGDVRKKYLLTRANNVNGSIDDLDEPHREMESEQSPGEMRTARNTVS
ncbi:protein moonraker [Elysia marginata]|uniref:Protein moonraker n=1 Tax=Elysia marginata TaxID=1093978 RepID=A0AAV4GZE2_9GAST|nr:protein moonraker [Elysia marginata]